MEEKIFDKDYFSALKKVNLNINQKLSSGSQGGRKSKAKGVSVEFSDFREYALGDDFRRIDWNAYGRLDKLFIKVFMEEREGIFNIFLDSSASMDFGEKNKKIMSLRVAGALTYIALNNLDRVNINTMNEGKLFPLKGGSNSKSFQNIIANLSEVEFKGKTNISKSICKSNLKKRGVSIIISDFLDSLGVKELEKSLRYLAYNKQEIILIQVLSEEEINPKIDREVTLIDNECDEKVKLTLNSRVIEAYKSELKKYNKNLEKAVTKYGGALIKVSTEEKIEEIILKDLSRKGITK